jgi:hypothetical protein
MRNRSGSTQAVSSLLGRITTTCALIAALHPLRLAHPGCCASLLGQHMG